MITIGTLWDIPPDEYPAYRREFGPNTVDFAEYQLRLAAAKTAMEEQGLRVYLYRGPVSAILREIENAELSRTPDGVAAAIGLAAAREQKQQKGETP